MESVYNDKKQSGFSKKKALAIALSIFAIAIIVSEPVYASVPWWITGIGAVAGGIVGSLTGSPIGTIAGAAAGAMIANYIYCAEQKTHTLQGYSNNQLYGDLYGASYENLTSQEMLNTEHSDNTAIQLLTEDYYYNAQAEEAVSLYYLNQTSLNCFNLSLASGSYATLNNISLSMYAPVDTVLWQTWYTGNTDGNKFFNTTYFTNSGVEGSQLTAGNYIFISPQNLSTEIYRCTSGTDKIELQNFYTGNTYNITSNGVLPFDTYSIPNGFYEILSVSGKINTAGIQVLSNGKIDTTLTYYSNGIFTGESTLGNLINAFEANNTIFSSEDEYFTSSGSYVGSLCNGAGGGGARYPLSQFTGLPNYYTNLQTDLNKYFTSASTYFSSLKELGFTNINQLPVNDVIPFPSSVVSSSMLNGTFNEQELQSLYFAYLNDLNNTFHNTTLYNGHNYTKYFNQSMFVNGFLTIYGNLTYQSGTTTKYINQTDFFIQTYDKNLYFAKGKTTQLIGEQYPVLILNGSQNGSLIYVDASIYVINLQLAGKNITSYTLEPEQITYILPQKTNIGAPNPNSLLSPVSNFLEKYYLILTVIIVIAVIAYIYDRKRPDSKGKGKE